jgi:hypothetical protein
LATGDRMLIFDGGGVSSFLHEVKKMMLIRTNKYVATFFIVLSTIQRKNTKFTVSF